MTTMTKSLRPALRVTSSKTKRYLTRQVWCHGIQHDDTLRNKIQLNGTQHYGNNGRAI